jgi:IPT/TIG domain
MKWNHRGASAAFSQSEQVSTWMIIVAVAVLVASVVACGGGGGTSEAANGAAGASGTTSHSDTACPTQGVGGDSVPPPCASLPAPAPPRGLSNPPTAASSAPPSTSCSPTGITAISPSSGSEAGGDPVSITGTGFCDAVEVRFADVVAPDMDVISDTEISAISPAGAGTVDVTVILGNGEFYVSPVPFTYEPPPPN